jgi:hypothetical protein
MKTANKDAALVVDERKETGCRDAESEEGHSMGHRVLEHERGRDHERGRIPQALEERGAEECRRPKRHPRGEIVQQEPGGYGHGAGHADYYPL